MASHVVEPLPKTAIPLPMEAIAAFCQKWGVREFALFGSVLREDFDPQRSDVDVLLDLADDPDRDPDYLFDMYEELTAMFGREVSVVELYWLNQSRNPYKATHIRESARAVYAA